MSEGKEPTTDYAAGRRDALQEALRILRKHEEEWNDVDEMGYRAAGSAVTLIEELLNAKRTPGVG